LDHLLGLFYAFARSESGKAFPPEREEEYKKAVAEGESKVRDLEGQIKVMRDKVQKQETQITMIQLHSQSQQV
jgi:TolA-binding protein